jgi:DNA-binding NarL/FixJ family response regulator
MAGRKTSNARTRRTRVIRLAIEQAAFQETPKAMSTTSQLLAPSSVDQAAFDECNSSIVIDVSREYGLTGRESEVLNAAAHGLSTKEIAFQLHLSGKTVEYFWSRIFGKLGCRSQIAVMALLLRRATDRTHRCTCRDQGIA